ncbi:hypothetical protein [Georgenia sp. Marseille-Q6866]
MTDSSTPALVTEQGPDDTRRSRQRSRDARHMHPQWRGLLWRAGLLPVAVMLPLLNLPLIADHRFNVFQFGGDLAQRPVDIVLGPIRDTPRYLELGNFRPLGRIVEKAQDYLTFELMSGLDLPATLGLRLTALLFAALLGVSVVILVATLSSHGRAMQEAPNAAASISALALPAMLIATSISSVVLFTSLYFASAALVLLAGAAAGRRAWYDTSRAGALPLVVGALAGGALAAFNEVAYLAPPLILMTVVARGWLTLGLSPRQLLRTKALKLALTVCVGFAAVFVPVRLLIARACADGSCYVASDINVSSDAIAALGHRLLSANPFAAWAAAEGTAPGWSSLKNLATVCVLVLAVALAVGIWRQLRRAALPSKRAAGALGVTGFGLLLLSSTMMALSAEVQGRVEGDGWPIGNGFRDVPLVAASVALLAAAVTVGLAHLLASRGRRPAPVLTVMAVLVTGAVLVTTHTNVEFAADQRPSANGALFDRISLAMLHLDESTDDERCQLLDEFADAYPKRTDWQGRLDRALDTAATAMAGTTFCEGDDE